MKWTERFNLAMEYIEQHLTEEIDYHKAAEIAGCPVYYFQKLFLYIADMPLAVYIRRRRMSLAAADLQATQEKIVDIALKYGYDSPTAFNRAFQSVHGVAPSRAREQRAPLHTYPMLAVAASVRGKEKLIFHIEKKEAFRLVGVRRPLSRELEENFSVIPGEWDKAAANGTLSRLSALAQGAPQGLLGVSIHHTEPWSYLIAVTSSAQSGAFEEYRIPAAEWAVFAGRGSNRSLQELERRVITEWLPSSGYAYANIPDIEVYLKADPAQAVYEYWLPVIKAASK